MISIISRRASTVRRMVEPTANATASPTRRAASDST
jgi:hypothetical protein